MPSRSTPGGLSWLGLCSQRRRISAARGSVTAFARRPRSIPASLGGALLRRVARTPTEGLASRARAITRSRRAPRLRAGSQPALESPRQATLQASAGRRAIARARVPTSRAQPRTLRAPQARRLVARGPHAAGSDELDGQRRLGCATSHRLAPRPRLPALAEPAKARLAGPVIASLSHPPCADCALQEIPAQKMGRTGIEPVTLGLKVPCSTN
jgi:hypothetical protein